MNWLPRFATNKGLQAIADAMDGSFTAAEENQISTAHEIKEMREKLHLHGSLLQAMALNFEHLCHELAQITGKEELREIPARPTEPGSEVVQ